MRTRLFRLFVLFAAGFSTLSFAEDTRDYYSEPGLNPFKETQGQDQSENIDPFSGVLQLQYTDIRIPGNGGLDIVIHRSYTNPQKTPGYYNMFGIGWQIGYGRIVVSTENVGGICGVANSGSSDNNPSVEHPDGAREVLVYNDINNNGGDGSLITKSNWKAVCITPSNYANGMRVTAPDGTQYTMNVMSTVYNSEGDLVETSFYTSRIEDVNGNWINLEYSTLPNRGTSAQKYLTRITAGRSTTADGREVTFEYIDQTDQPINANSLDVRLSKITNRLGNSATDQVWNYTYSQAAMATSIPHMYGLKFYQLTKVTRPDSTEWQYTYNPEILATDDSDSLALHTVTYPQGGVVTYDYQQVHFYTWTSATNLATHSIRTKTTSGSNITSGTWTYEFLPGSHTVSGHDGKADVTNVYRPDGAREVHYHYGHSYSLGYLDLLWPIGLKFQQETYDESNNLVETIYQTWGKRRISAEYYLQKVANDSVADRATWAPILTYKFISRYDGDNLGYAVTYTNPDKFGNPQTITANAAVDTYPDKITQLTYYNNESLWILGRTDTETINGITGNIDRTFDGLGRMTAETRYGVTTSHTYSVAGDLESTTDALTHTTYFDNYYRGIARLERKPEDNIQVVRTLNAAGTVNTYNITATSDARNLTKTFSYDKLNRLSTIDFRVGADVSVAWTGATKRTLTRGSYQEEAQYDGFGRQIKLIRKDNGAGTSITVNYTYDALGRKVFESFPNSTNKGVATTYTALNDVDRIDYPNGDYRDYVYTGELQVAITDGRGNTTTTVYNCNGLPDTDRTTYTTSTPLNLTVTEFNLLNQVARVTQGISSGGGITGYSRQFNYDSRQYLVSEAHPELAYLNYLSSDNKRILYQRDDLGNMLAKKAGETNWTVYSYDNLNRVTQIDYPNYPVITFAYSKTGKVKTVDATTVELKTDGTEETTSRTRAYTHDDNDNLTDEALAINGYAYALHYAYDNLDAVSAVTYPSGRVVARSPDAFGRPKRVGSYITNVNYHPSGQWSSLSYANGEIATLTLDVDRLWIDKLVVNGASSAVNLDYGYDIVGNVTTIANAVTASDSRTLGYDSLNRLTSAQGSWGGETMGYSAQDNIATKGNTTYNYSSQLLDGVTRSDNMNLFFGYDRKARVTGEWIYNYPARNYGYQNDYRYDGADNVIFVEHHPDRDQPASTTYKYTYDGKNNRVTRLVGNSTTHYVYSDDGTLMGEYTPDSIATGKENFYLGNQLVASIQSNQAPIANAGSAQSANGGVIVTLNGSASTDADGVIAAYAWTQLSGAQVTLSNASSVSPTFTAPQILGTRTQQFRLTVTDDDGTTGTSTVTITTTYTAPDTDGDGIHDAYEAANGLNPNNAADANQDADGDGVSNKNEYINNTNPRVNPNVPVDNDIPFLPPWALLLLGSGLAGTVLKHQRKQKELDT